MSSQRGFASVVFLIGFVLLFAGIPGGMYLFKTIQKPATNTSTSSQLPLSPSLTPTATPKSSFISLPLDQTLRTYINKEAGFEFKYPAYLEKMIQAEDSRNFNVSIEINSGTNPYKGRDCPEACGAFANNTDVYLKQFTILKKAASAKDCILDESFKTEFRKDFILFGGLYTDLQGIKLGNTCGVKYVPSNGMLVEMDLLTYTIAYIKGNKAVGIIFTLLPLHVFPQVDDLYLSLGSDFSGDPNTCVNNTCVSFGNGEKYIEKLKLKGLQSDETTRSVVQVYDQIFSTLKFTN